MYCTKKITDDVVWVGGNDRRLSMFEGVYSVPRGVSYNSYLIKDRSTVLMDTVDKAVSRAFFENLEHELEGRPLDYVVILHMEPDHSATLGELILRYPGVKVVCGDKAAAMIGQFFPEGLSFQRVAVKEGDTLSTGRHTLKFFAAPMVHWPEVMVCYEEGDKILFSADAFGAFGALNGAMFADEVDFDRDFMDEARRYYCNIVGKYGPQTAALLKKMDALDVAMICPLHGFVWRRDIEKYVEKYRRWSSYTPEEDGVMIAYASIYGHTENAAELLSARLRDMGVRTDMYDVSVDPASDIVSAAFRWSNLVFASATYNNGIFVSMDEVLRDLAAHNIQNRQVSIIENGSWAPASGRLMKEILSACKDITYVGETITLKSALRPGQEQEIQTLAEAIAASISGRQCGK